MKRIELIIKSREAMLSAVQIYNNPQIMFKSEAFITLSIISWTYLMHVYYANKNIDYRYWRMSKNGKRKIYDKTKYKAYKYWELERCLDDDNSPIDEMTKENLKFLIGIRHEIEHQMTNKIDQLISAKLQACCINYNYYIKKIFGHKYGVDKELGFSIQFLPLDNYEKKELINNEKITSNLKNYIMDFENSLTDENIKDPKYAYRVVFARVNVNRKGQADQVIDFLDENSDEAKNIEKTYAVIKETEKRKYYPAQIVKIINDEGYKEFTISKHTKLWQSMKKTRIEMKSKGYGTYIDSANKTWLWYEKWLNHVKKYCKENIKKDILE